MERKKSCWVVWGEYRVAPRTVWEQLTILNSYGQSYSHTAIHWRNSPEANEVGHDVRYV